MEEEGVTDPYDVESRVNGIVEEGVMNNVYDDGQELLQEWKKDQ